MCVCVYSRLIEMFMPSEPSLPPRRARANESQTKWDYVKTFYNDPVKW